MELHEWLGSEEENPLGHDLWKKKYRNGDETLDEWFDRVSNGDENVKSLIKEKKFLFGGRVLAGRNINSNVSYSNCYVIKSPNDNLEDIFRTCSEMARTYSYGGGCGIDISKLRPNGSKVNNSAKFSTGAVSFMPLFSKVTETIGQFHRRGALMISLNVNHPDVEEFIKIKTDLDQVNKANISLKITDDFMDAVLMDKEYELQFYFDDGTEYLVDGKRKTVKARDLFMKFAEVNWDYAEPGCLFWDRITQYNFLDHTPEFEYAAVNPCA